MWLHVLVPVSFAGPVSITREGSDGIMVRAESDAVFVPTCRGVTWQRFDAGSQAFIPTAPSACGALSPAVKVTSEGVAFDVDVPLPPLPPEGFHLLIPTVVVGQGCEEGVPFPLANCTSMEAIQGPQVLMRARGTAVPLSVAPEG